MTPSKKTKKFNRPERASLQDRSRGMSKDKISSGRILKAKPKMAQETRKWF